ncbi:MAG TPA: hypothetical protein PLA50_11285, partial [Bacteroidia bacterium]|nr:hypothetical protein [Bacteroidia bacterium]
MEPLLFFRQKPHETEAVGEVGPLELDRVAQSRAGEDREFDRQPPFIRVLDLVPMDGDGGHDLREFLDS